MEVVFGCSKSVRGKEWSVIFLQVFFLEKCSKKWNQKELIFDFAEFNFAKPAKY
jgi:hypothetical protein